MITTPKELVAQLKEMYKADMNQPIAVLIDDKEVFDEFILNNFGDVFSSADELPKEIMLKCFSNLGNDDRVHEAINDSYKFDVKEYMDNFMQEYDDKELWDK